MKTKQDYDQLWAQFKDYLKKEIGWYETPIYTPMTGDEFVNRLGKYMSDEFKTFMKENVILVNRQCDAYAIYFTGEEIPKD